MPDALTDQILLCLFEKHKHDARATSFYMELWLQTQASHTGDDGILDAAQALTRRRRESMHEGPNPGLLGQ
jgi:hypothetical protein